MSSKRDKWVRRFSVDETAKHKNGFTIYKITSVLFPLDSPEAVTVVSVWKRYSDVQKLHKNMKTLHSCLHLGGLFPNLVSGGYFKRFQQETIGDRAKSIKVLLEFIAEHRLLFASMEFVAFLQSGYPAPRSVNIDTHTTNTHSHTNHTPSLTNHTPSLTNHTPSLTNTRNETISPLREDEDSDSISRSAVSPLPPPLIPPPQGNQSRDETDYSQIPIHEPFNVELRKTPEKPISKSDSFESIASIDSLSSDMFEDINKMKIDVNNTKPLVKSRHKLPDLINFDAPSTSTRFDDYHTMKTDSETVSLNSTMYDSTISEVDSRSSKFSSYKDRSMLSLSNIESKTVTEDSYVFEAGYLLNLAARSEDVMDYQKAFDYYKAGIEKMLVGVQSDSDSRRRALIKKKTNKYLSYAENIYKNHLCNNQEPVRRTSLAPAPRLLRSEYRALEEYRALRTLDRRHVLLHRHTDPRCLAMKIVQKIPHNLTEFDEYFLQHTQETRVPILPTLVPYMVQLHSYIETNNLFFLILTYEPGERLIDYIKNYEKTAPNTPQRQVNLENVFAEPKSRTTDNQNNIDSAVNQSFNNNIDSELSVNELLVNSQRLLLNVDKALNEVPKKDDSEMKREDKIDIEGKSSVERLEGPDYCRKLPPSAICGWGAEILTALDGLHNCGVICRDLNPRNILLSSGGHISVTYMLSYPDPAVLQHIVTRAARTNLQMYVAPELFQLRWSEMEDEEEKRLDRVCDFWSFGAIMYELIVGKPLSYYHPSVFTSHTILHLPDNVPIEAQSLLTQLLTFDPRSRLGSGPEGINEIRTHPYFKQVDWDALYSYWDSQLLNANQASAV